MSLQMCISERGWADGYTMAEFYEKLSVYFEIIPIPNFLLRPHSYIQSLILSKPVSHFPS